MSRQLVLIVCGRLRVMEAVGNSTKRGSLAIRSISPRRVVVGAWASGGQST